MFWMIVSELLAKPFTPPEGSPPAKVRRMALLAIAVGLVLIAAAPITILIGRQYAMEAVMAKTQGGGMPGFVQLVPFFVGALPFSIGTMLVQRFTYQLFGIIGTFVTAILAVGFVGGCFYWYSMSSLKEQQRAVDEIQRKADERANGGGDTAPVVPPARQR
jgi:hypothetical protein